MITKEILVVGLPATSASINTVAKPHSTVGPAIALGQSIISIADEYGRTRSGSAVGAVVEVGGLVVVADGADAAGTVEFDDVGDNSIESNTLVLEHDADARAASSPTATVR